MSSRAIEPRRAQTQAPLGLRSEHRQPRTGRRCSRLGHFDLIGFDEITAKNLVAISGPARHIKLTITVQDYLGATRCTTLVVHGSEDFIVPKAPELADRLIPNSRLAVIPDSGHHPFIEQPEAFARALRDFVETTSLLTDGPDVINPHGR